MITLSYLVNLAILIPLLVSFVLRAEAMTPAFGADTDARRILICLYATIALASMIGLILLLSGQTETARTLGVTLFSLQIAYKLLTVPVIGLTSPVVITNLAVVALHSATLLTLWINRP